MFSNGQIESCTIGIKAGSSSWGNMFSNCNVWGHTGDGIQLNCIDNRLVNVSSHGNDGHGIKITKERNQIIGGLYSGNKMHGIYFYSPTYYSFHGSRVIGAEILRNSNTNPNIYDGICLENFARVIIQDCYAWDYSTAQQRYGINEVGVSAKNHILGCRTMTNATGGISKIANTTYIRNCIIEDAPTEANVLSGAFAIDSAGIKTVTIPHGLAAIPAKQDCYLTVVENTAVDDWSYDLLKVMSTDAVNVKAKINISKVSATGGATARLGLRVGGA